MRMHNTTCFNVTNCLYAAFLWLLLIFPASPAKAADRAGDEFLNGYVASILERGLHWERDSYILKIVNGVDSSIPVNGADGGCTAAGSTRSTRNRVI